MRVLFDHNVPHKLRRSLAQHEVQAADEMGWAGLENGDLLKAAEASRFDVMVTCDKNLSYQQNLKGRDLALVVLSTNYWPALKEDTGSVVKAVTAATPGSFQVVVIESRLTPKRYSSSS